MDRTDRAARPAVLDARCRGDARRRCPRGARRDGPCAPGGTKARAARHSIGSRVVRRCYQRNVTPPLTRQKCRPEIISWTTTSCGVLPLLIWLLTEAL